MDIFLYKKFDESGDSLIRTGREIRQDGDALFSVTENRRSFREFDTLTRSGRKGSVVVVNSLESIGANAADTASRISGCIKSHMLLVCCGISSTYKYGMGETVNRAVWEAVLYMLRCSMESVGIFHPEPSPGRPSAEYPDGWGGKYQDWKNGRITSKEFIKWSGFKRATFYNKMTEYATLMNENESFKRQVDAV